MNSVAAVSIIAAMFAMLIAFNSHSSFAQEPACDYKAEVLLNGTEFERHLKWKVKATRLAGMPTNITGTAVIRDLSGESIKLYRIWSSEPISRLKTSNERAADLEEGNQYTLTAEINVKCSDTNKSNDIATKIIKIKGKKMENVISLNADVQNAHAQKSQSSCVAYESSDEISKKLIMGLLLALSILLNIVLIWKR